MSEVMTIRAYVDLNEWQISEIKAALKEADAGDFASGEEVQAVVSKWSRGALATIRSTIRAAADGSSRAMYVASS